MTKLVTLKEFDGLCNLKADTRAEQKFYSELSDFVSILNIYSTES